jgi:hypothetical protein
MARLSPRLAILAATLVGELRHGGHAQPELPGPPTPALRRQRPGRLGPDVGEPARGRLVGTQSAPVAYAGGCPGSKPLSFSVTGAVNPIGASAYSLRAAVEGDLADEEDPQGDRFAWRKYDPAQTRLTVIFEPAA